MDTSKIGELLVAPLECEIKRSAVFMPFSPMLTISIVTGPSTGSSVARSESEKQFTTSQISGSGLYLVSTFGSEQVRVSVPHTIAFLRCGLSNAARGQAKGWLAEIFIPLYMLFTHVPQFRKIHMLDENGVIIGSVSLRLFYIPPQTEEAEEVPCMDRLQIPPQMCQRIRNYRLDRLVVEAGQLVKQGHQKLIRRKWEDRWCVLMLTGELFYFKQPLSLAKVRADELQLETLAPAGVVQLVPYPDPLQQSLAETFHLSESKASKSGALGGGEMASTLEEVDQTLADATTEDAERQLATMEAAALGTRLDVLPLTSIGTLDSMMSGDCFTKRDKASLVIEPGTGAQRTTFCCRLRGRVYVFNCNTPSKLDKWLKGLSHVTSVGIAKAAQTRRACSIRMFQDQHLRELCRMLSKPPSGDAPPKAPVHTEDSDAQHRHLESLLSQLSPPRTDAPSRFFTPLQTAPQDTTNLMVKLANVVQLIRDPTGGEVELVWGSMASCLARLRAQNWGLGLDGDGDASTSEQRLPPSDMAAEAAACAMRMRAARGLGTLEMHQYMLAESEKVAYQFSPRQFKLLTQLGEGSYGTVWSAQLVSNPLVEVGIKSTQLDDEDARESFQVEFEVLRYCRHPNIVNYYGIAHEKEHNRQWIIMELARAGSLQDMVQRMQQPLTEPEIAYVVREVLKALAYMHEDRRIIHRDVKCGNILLCPDGSVKLADFGVARRFRADESVAQTISLIGTAHWIAPESWLADQSSSMGDYSVGYSFLADMWSLGITLYEMAVGLPPHHTCSPAHVFLALQTYGPPTLPEEDKELPFAQIRSTRMEAQEPDPELAEDAVPQPNVPITGIDMPPGLDVRGKTWRESAAAAAAAEQGIDAQTLLEDRWRGPSRWSLALRGFLAHCLIMDPAQRPTAHKLLTHPFIRNAGGSEVIMPRVNAFMRFQKAQAEAKQQ